MDVAFNVSERVTVLNEGAVIEEGTPEEISANEMVQKVYLGERLDD
jgi:branched-chain amino acid transport system ATP-binding protein